MRVCRSLIEFQDLLVLLERAPKLIKNGLTFSPSLLSLY
jgi:hypothetical protein